MRWSPVSPERGSGWPREPLGGGNSRVDLCRLATHGRPRTPRFPVRTAICSWMCSQRRSQTIFRRRGCLPPFRRLGDPMTSEPTIAPYGTWQSPISAASVAAGSVHLGGPHIVGDRVLWLESRPSDGGRTVLVERQANEVVRDLTPDGFNVRSRVHEYGGGAYVVSGDVLFFSNWSDQRLYRQDAGNPPVPITPEPPTPAAWRYADGRPTPDGQIGRASCRERV